jgi:hypothetical protein
VAAHPDWKIVCDYSSFINVVDDAEWHQLVEIEGRDPLDEWFPIYRMVGSRLRKKNEPTGS